MAKYQVVIPWLGVSAGQIVELNDVHPSIEANVRKFDGDTVIGTVSVDVAVIAKEEADRILAEAKEAVASMIELAKAEAETIISDANAEAERIKAEAVPPKGELTPATPGSEAERTDGDRKAIIVARLKELGIEFDARKGADKLAELLPEGELQALFPAA